MFPAPAVSIEPGKFLDHVKAVGVTNIDNACITIVAVILVLAVMVLITYIPQPLVMMNTPVLIRASTVT